MTHLAISPSVALTFCCTNFNYALKLFHTCYSCGMAYSQKYSIVQFFQSVDEDAVFSINDWPLHTNLVDVFAVHLDESVLDRLTKLLATKRPMVIKAVDDTTLGSTDNPVLVTLIEKDSNLQSLHDDLVSLLEQCGAVFNSPQYTHEGFLPHCTVQRHARINPDDSFEVNELSIIDMFVDGDWEKRKVLKKIKLSAKRF